MATDAKQIKTNPDPYEAFNIAQAYRAGDFIFVSGQAALDLEDNIVGEGDFEAALKQIEGETREGSDSRRGSGCPICA